METKNQPADDILWPPEMDALLAAPDHHILLFENERARVLQTIIMPGETTPVHTHCWPSVYYIQSWSQFIRRDGEGKVLVDSRSDPRFQNPPVSMWSEPLPPHSLENVGAQPIKLVSVELKD